MSEALVQPSNVVYATFAGPIDQTAVQRVFNGVAAGMANKVEAIHMLFQSFGGSVGDGVCLYNYFRSLPLDLTLYNVGNISSAATVAFLGAKRRKTSAYATFMVHKAQSPGMPATAERLHAIAHSVVVDDQRLEAILRQDLRLTDDQWAVHRVADLWLTAQEAADCGLAELGEFAPPPGTQIYNV